jgi:hypothetical protein
MRARRAKSTGSADPAARAAREAPAARPDGVSTGAQGEAVLTRKITGEESNDSFVTVEKVWLKHLPALGQEFTLVRGNSTRRVAIQSYPCTCRGEDKPHEHYQIRLPLENLPEGRTVTLRVLRPDKVAMEIA